MTINILSSKCTIIILMIAFSLALQPSRSSAFLYHATKKAAAKRIMKNGFNQSRMKNSARFGKGVYVAESPQTALKEAPRANTVIKFQESQYLKRNTLNLRQPNKSNINKIIEHRDFRGDIKKGVIGGNLGEKIGTAAGQKGKVIRYQSKKNPKGTNIFIPKKTYQNLPEIVRPRNLMDYKK